MDKTSCKIRQYTFGVPFEDMHDPLEDMHDPYQDTHTPFQGETHVFQVETICDPDQDIL